MSLSRDTCCRGRIRKRDSKTRQETLKLEGGISLSLGGGEERKRQDS